jgi:hypothetical protein
MEWRSWEEHNIWASIVLAGAAGIARWSRTGDAGFDGNSVTFQLEVNRPRVCRQRPKGRSSPIFHRLTPSPISTISPADSWPDPHYPYNREQGKLLRKHERRASSVTTMESPTRPCFQKWTSLLIKRHIFVTIKMQMRQETWKTYPHIPVARTCTKTWPGPGFGRCFSTKWISCAGL